MTAPEPVGVAEVRARAAHLVERELRTWAASGADDVQLTVALRAPTERQVLAELTTAQSWVRSWRDAEAVLPVHVDWVERRWASVGTQRVPIRVIVQGPDAIAAVGGDNARKAWVMARDRAQAVRDRLSSLGTYSPEPGTGDSTTGDALSPVLRHHVRALAALPEHDFLTLLDVVEWLIQRPASGFRVRQLPIRGIHTKWLESHLSLVTALHKAVTGQETLGLVMKEDLVRVRFLDEALAPGSARDLSAPAAELAALAVEARLVLVLENLETVLSLPPMPGVVAVHGGGNAVASRLRPVTWVMSTPIVYWGDLDTYGFRILAQLRAEHSAVRSVLMDVGTLVAHRDLWGPEKSPVRGPIGHLTESESETLRRLRDEGDVRLEQERIPWTYALRALSAATA
jgi:hypothetical protein